jgi:hypothetical protein
MTAYITTYILTFAMLAVLAPMAGVVLVALASR